VWTCLQQCGVSLCACWWIVACRKRSLPLELHFTVGGRIDGAHPVGPQQLGMVQVAPGQDYTLVGSLVFLLVLLSHGVCALVCWSLIVTAYGRSPHTIYPLGMVQGVACTDTWWLLLLVVCLGLWCLMNVDNGSRCGSAAQDGSVRPHMLVSMLSDWFFLVCCGVLWCAVCAAGC
jgi:hypothetical protein